MTEEYSKPELTILPSEYIATLVGHQRELREVQIKALEELLDARLDALAIAVTKQEQAYNLRFESVNEWRQTYGDLANRAVSLEVFVAKTEDFERRLSAIESKQANVDGRIIGWSAGMGFLVMLIGFLSGLIG